jgi:hypothetical protein
LRLPDPYDERVDAIGELGDRYDDVRIAPNDHGRSNSADEDHAVTAKIAEVAARNGDVVPSANGGWSHRGDRRNRNPRGAGVGRVVARVTVRQTGVGLAVVFARSGPIELVCSAVDGVRSGACRAVQVIEGLGASNGQQHERRECDESWQATKHSADRCRACAVPARKNDAERRQVRPSNR